MIRITRSKLRPTFFVWAAVIAILCLALSGCGGAKLTYKVSGTVAQANIEYRNEKGQLEMETANLPWEKTISIGDKFSFQVNVTNTTDSGTVTCAVLVAGKEMGPTTGVTYARCTGTVSKQGNSTSWDFHGEYDKPKSAQAPTSTPLKAIPTLSPTRAATATPQAAAHTRMGIQYFNEGKLDEAAAEFQKAIELDPKDPDNHRNLGTVYLVQGKLSESVAAYEQAIKLNPKFGEAYGDLAGAYSGLKKYPEAIAAAKKSIELTPNYVTAYNNLGRVYYVQGKLDEAMTTYQKGLQVNANYALLHYNRGVIYRDLGRPKEAIAELETYLRLSPKATDKAAVEKDIALLKEVTATPTLQYNYSAGGFSVYYPKAWFKLQKQTSIVFAATEKALDAPVGTFLKESPRVTFLVSSPATVAKVYGVKESTDPAEFLTAMGAKLKEAETTQSTRLLGYPAAIADVSGVSGDGAPYKSSHLIVFVGDKCIYAVGMSAPDEWEALRPLLRAMLMSLSFPKP